MFVPRSDCALYMIRGADRLDFLQRISTNNISLLKTGAGIATVLTTPKGRILDLLTLYCFDDHLLALGSKSKVTQVLDHFKRYTITEDVVIADATDSYDIFALFVNDHASTILSTVEQVGSMPLHSHIQTVVDGSRVTICRGIFFRGSGFNVIVEKSAGKKFDVFRSFGLVLGSSDHLEAFRIHEGIPGWGTELNESYNPLEVGAESAVSFTTGCYIGQEIIARLYSQKKVQRELMGIQGAETIRCALPLALRIVETEIGEWTSAVPSSQAGGTTGLCVVRKEFAKDDQGVEVQTPVGTISARLRTIKP